MYSTMALEQGAQQACKRTVLHPSGIMISGCFDMERLLLLKKHCKITKILAYVQIFYYLCARFVKKWFFFFLA
jgi:hypothetical protein